MKKNNTKFLTKKSIDKINDSRSISEGYSHMLNFVFNEEDSILKIKYNTNTRNLDLIPDIYRQEGCFKHTEKKFKIYQLLKVIRDQKAYEILENKECKEVLKKILSRNYLWIKNPQYWVKNSRNPYKQTENLINYLFCKYKAPSFLMDCWFSNFNGMDRYYKWFFHLTSGKSARNLPGIYFKGWTKKLAHDFVNISNVGSPVDALIKTISKNSGGNNRLYPYFYISKIQEGILKSSESEFWFSFIEYFSKQGMFDYEHISHIADYVYNIKYDSQGDRKPENPKYEIKRKNLNTVLKETEEWMGQLQRFAKAIGIAARQGFITEQISNQKKQFETKWEKAHNGKWEHTQSIKVGKEKVKVTYFIQELNTGQELFNEGRTMNHCVYSYIGSCVSGKCRIYSLREKSTQGSILTIEVRNGILVQIRGKSNRRMQPDEQNIIEQWCQATGYRM